MATTTIDAGASTPGAGSELAACLVRLAAVIDAGPGEASAPERRDVVIGLAGVLGRVEAVLGSFGEIAERNGDHVADGARSLRSWLAARSELSPAEVGRCVGRARDLRRYPLLADAAVAGRLGLAKLRLLLEAARHVEASLERDQAVLVEALAPLTVAHARVAIARWREGALGELAASPEEPKPVDVPVNSVRYGAGVNGERTLSGIFDSVTGGELASLIDGEVDRARREGATDVEDGKTYGQRRAEALLALARRGCAVKTEHGEARRSVDVIVDLRWLFGVPDDLDPTEVMAWPCQLGDGTPIPLSDVLAGLDDATIHLIFGVLDRTAGRFRPVGEVTTNRIASASQRRLLRARDQECQYPGCDATGRWTRAHHEPPFEVTHRTTVPELVLLCPYHHRLRHHGDQHFDLHPDGDLTITRPDGTRQATTATGRKLPADREPDVAASHPHSGRSPAGAAEPSGRPTDPARARWSNTDPDPPATSTSPSGLAEASVPPTGWQWRTVTLPDAA